MTPSLMYAPGFVPCRDERPDNPMIHIHPSAWKVLGLGLEETFADVVSELTARIAPEDRERLARAIVESRRTRRAFRQEFRVPHSSLGEFWVEVFAIPAAVESAASPWRGFVTDITGRKREENEFALLHTAMNMAHGGWWAVFAESDGTFRFGNEEGVRVLGYGLDEARRMRAPDFVPDLAPDAWPVHVAELKAKGSLLVTTRSRCKNGDLIPVEVSLRHFVNGGQGHVLAIARDIRERLRMEQALAAREREFRRLVEYSPDSISRYDRECRRIYANPRLMADYGVAQEVLLGKTPEEFPGGLAGAEYCQRLRAVLGSGELGEFEWHWPGANGRTICSQIRLVPEFDQDGRIEGVLAVGRDISEIDRYRWHIHRLANFDALTDLPNRLLMNQRVSLAIADANRRGSQFGLMLLDLDRFKEINDTLGHGVGDHLLREVAERISICIHAYDTVARLGGDEFAILLPEIREAADLGGFARKILHTLTDPFLIDGKELFVSASIGIALYPDDSTEIDGLFKYADSAMYHAKKLGRNNFQFYQAELSIHSSRRMALETALRKATRRGELELYFQPQVDLFTGGTTGAEALVRWRRAEGLVPPDQFIPIAEETGLILEIGEWVLYSACRISAEWNRNRDDPFKIAVNLSTRQFIQHDLVGLVRRVAEETGCRPEWLKLEITESLLLEDSIEIRAALEELNLLGFALSIDDFGTGYSALSYLNYFPVSQIKIDRSFVQGIPDDSGKSELVKAMISIAQALRLELVAEGVETREQADYLRRHGCPLAQGYLYGKPMPRDRFEIWLAGAG